MRCPSCSAVNPDSNRFCSSCGSALDALSAPASPPVIDATRLPHSTPSPATPRSPGGGWLSTSASIDHGQFAPGTIIAERYRIVGLVGRGGMGEVYRADDLRLGQPVALKLLPPALAGDGAHLTQFHAEVRTARQVSHPNVCRVYDIGEVDGRLYLSMEYVDGEDLSSLLRRIGRLPEDKAVDIARQICAGLAAAHERGVIHRDLKPANIMIDGSGKARIMDFSLASVGEVAEVRAGTPAYMAPEQLEGREVTPRSDIYALGLVLYELMTGRRVFDAKTLADLVAEHQSGTITPPTEIVKTLDRAIERTILRCLERDPALRPSSAIAVAASLPGGDPLAAALAAGETPSPEMVAASGIDTATVSARAGLLWLAVAAAFVLGAAWIGDQVLLFARTPLPKPADVLLDRAEDIRQSIGYAEPAGDRASGFAFNRRYLDWAAARGAGAARWSVLAGGRPAPLRFWYRTSPRTLVPTNPLSTPGLDDPPLFESGMTRIEVDALGRLVVFEARPPQAESIPPPGIGPADWSKLFAAAALDPAAFSETASLWTPQTFADERRAWKGRLPGTDVDVRLEGAAYRGRPVFFEIVGPWTPAMRDIGIEGRSASGNSTAIGVVIIVVLLLVAAVLARANFKSGRADRRGAFRLAAFAFSVRMAAWLLSPHVENLPVEQLRLFVGIGLALFIGGSMYLVYLALEPYVRRSWPAMLVGWSRALSGRVRDAIIGRDLLVGSAAGAVLAILAYALAPAVRLTGQPDPVPAFSDPDILRGGWFQIRSLLFCVDNGLQQGLIQVLLFALIRDLIVRILKRFRANRRATDSLVTAVAIALFTMLSVLDSTAGARLSTAIFAAIAAALAIQLILRIGLFAAAVMYVVDLVLERTPLTLDASRIYAPAAWIAMAGVVAVAMIGLWMARAGEPFFGRRAETP